MIYYVLLSLGVVVLLYLLIMQGIANLKREKAKDELREKWQNALIDEKRTKETIMELIKKLLVRQRLVVLKKVYTKKVCPIIS